MPNDCFRTVNVSRAPAPWRLSTIPSNTWIRCRCPSITLKCTRTVSPALNCGIPSRSWARSRLSMMLLIGRKAGGREQMLANVDSLRAALDLEDGADEVLRRDEAPDARVARRAAVVAEEQVFPRRDPATGIRLRVAVRPRDVRLAERSTVDQDRAGTLRPALVGPPDHALDEEAARPADLRRTPRRLEDDDVAARGMIGPVRPDRDMIDALPLTSRLRAGAVKCRLHRRRRDAEDTRVAVRRASRSEENGAGERCADQWNEMRLAGQYVANTSPMRFFRGTRPQTRESQDEARLSPIIRYIFGGIRVIVRIGGRSLNVRLWLSRRSAWT